MGQHRGGLIGPLEFAINLQTLKVINWRLVQDEWIVLLRHFDRHKNTPALKKQTNKKTLSSTICHLLVIFVHIIASFIHRKVACLEFIVDTGYRGGLEFSCLHFETSLSEVPTRFLPTLTASGQLITMPRVG